MTDSKSARRTVRDVKVAEGRSDESILDEVVADASNFRDHIRWICEDVKGRKAKRIVELGVCMGQSTFALLCAARALGGHLDSVDVTDYPEPRANAKRFGLEAFWTYHVMRSQDYAAKRTEPIDALLIDSSHEYGQTLEELRLFAPLVAAGGVIYMHDVLAETPVAGQPCRANVQAALFQFLGEEQGAWTLFVRPWSCGLAVLQRASAT